MDLNELISGLGVRVVGDAAGVRVCDITEDSRTAVPGSLFIARVGLKFDGRESAADAAECGAVAVLADTEAFDPPLPRHQRPVVLVTDRVAEVGAALAERFYGEPSSNLELVGVTGTNGKTSVATMTRAILQAFRSGGPGGAEGVRTGLIGTVEVDDGREVAPAAMTTPPAVELSRTLASMVDAGCRAACMEVSSHALDQRRADGLRFAVAVFTNLSGDHIDYHKSEQAYLAAKRRLFELLPAEGVRVLNADDPASDAMDGPNARWCSVVGGAGDARASWRASVVSADLSGMELAMETPLGPIAGRAPVVGGHCAMNVLQSAAAADAVLERLGVGAEARRAGIERALPSVRPPRGRLELVSGAGDAMSVFVDYAHTDDALARTLSAVREVLPEGSRLTVVFGCGGDRDTTKRPRMGQVAAGLADRIVVTSDNPRSERPSAIVDQVLAGIGKAERHKATVQVDRARAIHHAITTARPGEVVVIAGKGHETEQISCDGAGHPVTRHFDDAEQARGVLRERRMRLPVGGGGGGGTT
ncbi:MAG: UDP-N-acetylmuramoyl-L-alanyl-D-glutamate--2,6-diaminopimelate ligase [Phycisphaerales bacterium]|nr:UDP-N-acetylmuramoyl-L-alanyl-D-glutamate--2,6-diaminopimelate ligase [Planctomycetota bacterium]MCH8508860.1 UDP-N-acetylmuramoyl-L-alanyl-D-glutamate--2,6-diaminopimelate ligase [Phycisphaerales bacterium]